MIVEVTKKYGATAQVKLSVDNTTPKDGLALLSFLLQPDYCGKCKSTKITLDSNVANTDDGQFVYLKRKCLNPQCKAQSTLGENKGGKGYFWKEWEIYQAGSAPQTTGVPVSNISTGTPPATPPPSTTAPVIEGDDGDGINVDDIPF